MSKADEDQDKDRTETRPLAKAMIEPSRTRQMSDRTVGNYRAGNLINAGPLTLARHRAFLSWRPRCPTCGANCMTDPCTHRPSFVADVPGAQVAGGALELFNNDTATGGKAA